MPDVPNMDDANLALRLYELRREPELRKARKMVGDLLDGASWRPSRRCASTATRRTRTSARSRRTGRWCARS